MGILKRLTAPFLGLAFATAAKAAVVIDFTSTLENNDPVHVTTTLPDAPTSVQSPDTSTFNNFSVASTTTIDVSGVTAFADNKNVFVANSSTLDSYTILISDTNNPEVESVQLSFVGNNLDALNNTRYSDFLQSVANGEFTFELGRVVTNHPIFGTQSHDIMSDAAQVQIASIPEPATGLLGLLGLGYLLGRRFDREQPSLAPNS